MRPSLPTMPDQSVIPRPSRQARHDELITAAFTLFVERGFAATRLEDVAHLAGVAKGTVVIHFPTKEQLFTAVVIEHVAPTVQRAESLRDTPGSPSERIVALLRFIRMVLMFIGKQLAREGNDTAASIAKCLLCYVGSFKRFTYWMLEFFNELGQFVLSYMVSQWYGTPYTDSDGHKSLVTRLATLSMNFKVFLTYQYDM